MHRTLAEGLASPDGGRILLAVLDGLGDISGPSGMTPLEAASTPNLDALAPLSALGQHIPVSHGITPGSGPAHLALFGYDPVEFFVGRGILSALGVGFPVVPGDLAARANFCTLGPDGRITDRRAGRIDSSENARLVSMLDGMRIDDVEVFVRTEKEHRACVVFRGEGLGEAVGDSDPGHAGLPPLVPVAHDGASARSARVVSEFLRRAGEALAGEHPANGILLRGFASHRPYPSMADRFRLRAAAAALYPMYRGVAALVGMDMLRCATADDQIRAAELAAGEGYDLLFLHHKPTDSSGEDGDFEAKTAAVESFDRMLPGLLDAGFDVTCITGDHSTPCPMKLHSWHPVPVLVSGGPQRTGWSRRLTEREAASGALGTFMAVDLMPILLASAGRLEKYGA